LTELDAIKIVSYQEKYASAFKALNKEWIDAYFKMEEADYRALDNPQSYIIDRGGKILIALCKDIVVGVCALQKMDHEKYNFELAKMAVSPNYQGRGIGYMLGNAIITEAKTLGANVLYLESNTRLKPAIQLYYKLGFIKIEGMPSPYERSNIQMELNLSR